MTATLIILALTIIFFVHGKVRTDLVALGSMMALMLTGILTPAEALSGFSSNIVLIMAGVFVMGGAVFRTGLARTVSGKILQMAGNNETKLFLLLMAVTGSIGAFVSNTGTVALMMPIVVSLASSAGVSPRRFLMPLAFMSSMGGMLTLIGTPPNMVISDVLVQNGYPALTLFSFFPVGVVSVLLGTGAMLLLSRMFLSSGKSRDSEQEDKYLSLNELVDKYHLAEHTFLLRIPHMSALVGKTLRELDLPQRHGIFITEVRRKLPRRNPFAPAKEAQINPEPGTVLHGDDVIFLSANLPNVAAAQEEYGLTFVDNDKKRRKDDAREQGEYCIRFDAIGVAELVILSSSRFVNRSVMESGLREKHGITVLGIQRQDEYILDELKHQKIQAGDALLVQGSWDAIGRLERERKEWVVVGQPLADYSKQPLDSKASTAAVVMVLMVASMATGLLPAVTAVLLAAMAVVLLGCFKNTEEAYSYISWEAVVLIAAMLPMALALEKTGVSAMVGAALVKGFQSHGPFVLMAVIYAIASGMTFFISNTASAFLIAPLALQVARDLGYSPYPFLFAVTVGTSMCFASPFSSPPNALVMSAGRYSFMDYLKVGIPLQLLFAVVMVLVLPIIFPF